MPRNVEIKVPLPDPAAARAAVIALGARTAGVDEQVDRYYVLDGGRRLKLRTGRDGAQLISYDRPESAGVRPSDYAISPVRDDAGGARAVPRGEPLAVVRKRREVLLLDNVRIHLDDVDVLGTYLELEAVVDDAHDEAACRRQVEAIMAVLRVAEADCVRASYGDLLAARVSPGCGDARA